MSCEYLIENPLNSSINILGVQVHPITIEQLHQCMADFIRTNEHALVLNVNVNCINLCQEHRWLKSFLNRADIVFCDGFGIQLAAWILGHKIPERITYADWMWQVADLSYESNFSLFFLGGKPGVADKAARNLNTKYPGLRIHCQHGYFDKTYESQENKTMLQQIKHAKPNILVLGFGMPMQERWLMENWDRLEVNIALTGGAVFDYLSGELRRAPRWMTDHGMEWVGRLIIEPSRLWKRYLIGNPLFMWRVVMQRIGRRPESEIQKCSQNCKENLLSLSENHYSKS